MKANSRHWRVRPKEKCPSDCIVTSLLEPNPLINAVSNTGAQGLRPSASQSLTSEICSISSRPLATLSWGRLWEKQKPGAWGWVWLLLG